MGRRASGVRRRLAVCLVLAVVTTARAQDDDIGPVTPAAPPSTTAAPSIDPTAGAETDRAIERRLRGIYAELEGLEGLRIAVRGGVVDLSGEVLSAELRERALRLARAVHGVVEVEDRMTEVRDVQRRVAPIVGRLAERGAAFLALLPLLVVALVVFAVFWLAGSLVGRWDRPFRRMARNRFLADLLQQLVRMGIVLMGVLVALELLDASALLGTVLGAAGILGLALGFALRDTVENYIASLLLSLRQPFAHGDLVAVAGFEGHVLRLTSRATVLLTIDGNHVRIPNATVYKSVVVNYTGQPSRRFTFEVGVGTEQDLAAAQRLGAETLGRMGGVLDDPPPVATVEKFGDSSMVLQLAGWVDQGRADYLKVRSEAIRLVKQAFDAAGIRMPEPLFGVRLAADAAPAEEPAAHDAPKRTPAGPAVAVDIAPRTHVERRIAHERADHAEDDLLTPEAPRE